MTHLHTGGLRLVGDYDSRTNELAEQFDPAVAPVRAGVALVEASAGTGKTYCITNTVLRLLLEPKDDGTHRTIDRILVVTFTVAATDELITRVRRALTDAVGVFCGTITDRTKNVTLFDLYDRHGSQGLPRLQQALESLDQLSVFTIHGFCKRVLEESALESGTPFDAKLLDDDAAMVERNVQDWWRRTIYSDPRLAALAVHKDWKWNMFVPDLSIVRRWPDTVLDPGTRLPRALAQLDRAVAAFGAAWDRDRAEEFFAERRWIGSSPLRTPESRAPILASGDALAAGDIVGGLLAAGSCCSASVLHPRNGVGRQGVAAELREATGTEPFVVALDAVSTALDAVRQALCVSCVEEVRDQLDVEKERRHLLGFDDLLRRLRDAIRAEPHGGQMADAIRRRYDAALIDEFQDTDAYQYEIFRVAFDGLPLFLIGDPKQAIYGFRGADVFAYMEAAKKADDRYTLAMNWRSTDHMVRGVNALFGRAERAFLYDEIPFAGVSAAKAHEDPLAGDGKCAFHWWFMPPDGAKPIGKGKADERVREAVCREIVSLVSRADASGKARVKPGDIAVLVRSGWEGEEIQRALRKLDVPAIMSGTGNILESRELADLECLLRAVDRPQHAPALRGALATELWGKTARQIHEVATAENGAGWDAFVDEMVAARATWARHGFMRMIQEWIGRHAVTERLLALADGERRLTNLRHAVELLHATAVTERLSPEGLQLWIARARADSERRKGELTELRLETDADAVQVMTIHKSKGLEFPVVFCPSLTMPKLAGDDDALLVHEEGQVVFDHGSPRHAERLRRKNAERLAEDLRLAYVAMTRASLRTYVAWGAVENQKEKFTSAESALAYLLRGDYALPRDEADVAELVAGQENAGMGAWGERLAALAAAQPAGVMSVEQLDGSGERASRWVPAGAGKGTFAARTFLPAPMQLDTWSIASFTSLTRDRHVEDARDVADGGEMREPHERVELPRSDFLAFPAGAKPGIALHAIFEDLDFAAPADVRDELVRETLLRHALADDAGDARIAGVTGMVERVLGARLPGADFCLQDLDGRKMLREWGFHLPLGDLRDGMLADLFAARGDDLARRYAPALRGLTQQRTHGFLTGVVDLVFEHGGRWHVADWKSNHLGNSPSDYEPAAIEGEMFESHYVLQYHLYVAALHRFLTLRLPGYSYSTHMGGVWYAFLRGIDGSARGWHQHRPAEGLVTALGELMTVGEGRA